jgi:hypothetical protein
LNLNGCEELRIYQVFLGCGFKILNDFCSTLQASCPDRVEYLLNLTTLKFKITFAPTHGK